MSESLAWTVRKCLAASFVIYCTASHINNKLLHFNHRIQLLKAGINLAAEIEGKEKSVNQISELFTLCNISQEAIVMSSNADLGCIRT